MSENHKHNVYTLSQPTFTDRDRWQQYLTDNNIM